MRRIIFLLILFFGTNVYAASSGFLVIAKGEGYVPVLVKLDKKADCVAIPLHISCNEKNSAKRLGKIQKAFKRITERAENDNNIDLKKGVVSLSAEELSTFAISKSYYGSKINLYLLATLKEKSDIFSVTENLIKFVSTIPKVEDVNYRMGTTKLGILDPEQYRNELTKLIAKDAERIKSELGGFDHLEISGLESPVLVSQRNDTDVTLYIHYKISIKK
jgi:hypothetical protein